MQLNCIKAILEEKGISQKWLSKQVKRSFGTVNSWCQNKSQPSLEILSEIADKLNVDVRELIVSKHLNDK
mgnify:FL=1